MSDAGRSKTGRPPAVLLHGFTGSGASWEGAARGLAARGRVPVAMDLPGHGRFVGRSDPDEFTLPAVLDTIAGAATWPADLIGYSLGGRLALHFVAAFPERVRRLVLESSSPGLEDATERAARRDADRGLAARIVEGGIEAFVAEWETLPLFLGQVRLSPETRSRQRAGRLANDSRSLAASLEGLGTGALPSLWDRLPAIATPTLVIAGEEDAKFVEIARRMVTRMPRALLSIVPRAGHTVHLEQPTAFLETVAGFLEDAEPTPDSAAGPGLR